MDFIARLSLRPASLHSVRPGPATTQPGPAAAPPQPAAPAARPEPARGCGWFDSSHELQSGLLITEHDSPDRVANELPLDVWLAWHLADAAGAQPGQRA